MPPRVERTVFISYRRTNFPWALAIFQELAQHGYDVFFDFTGLASGDFERVILENIYARAHFLVLLTPSALERCGDPDDWLRLEVEAAIGSKRNIVPLMLEGFDFGSPTIGSQLTGKMAVLKQYNALNIPADYFMEAMGRLRNRFLNVPLDAVLHPASLAARQAAKDEKGAAAMAPEVAEEELTAQQWFERGFDTGQLEEKVRFYSKAIRLKPDYALALYNRAYARYLEGDAEGGAEDYNQAIRLQPNYAEAFNSRGDVPGNKTDFDDYDAGPLFEPNAAHAFHVLAEAFNKRGNARRDSDDLEGALQDYSQAILLKPDFAEALYNRAIARRSKGDLEGAIRDENEASGLGYSPKP